MDFTHFFNLHIQIREMLQMDLIFNGENQSYIYTPKNKKTEKMPLLIMLHGTTQNALSFAGQTKMNDLAEEFGFCVAYIDKSVLNNPSKAFDWITKYEDNKDIESIEILIERLKDSYSIDQEKVYVAGLSAGAALAAILIEKNPNLVNGAAMIGGLPPDSASSIREAFKAMKEGSVSEESFIVEDPKIVKKLDILIIHGNEDNIVNMKNANINYKAMTKLIDLTQESIEEETINKTVEVLENGNIIRTSRTINGSTVVFEEISGMGHVWRGGDMAFSYSDEGEENNSFSVSEKIVQFFGLDEPKKELQLNDLKEKNCTIKTIKYRRKIY